MSHIRATKSRPEVVKAHADLVQYRAEVTLHLEVMKNLPPNLKALAYVDFAESNSARGSRYTRRPMGDKKNRELVGFAIPGKKTAKSEPTAIIKGVAHFRLTHLGRTACAKALTLAARLEHQASHACVRQLGF